MGIDKTAGINCHRTIAIVPKPSMLDVCEGPEYAYETIVIFLHDVSGGFNILHGAFLYETSSDCFNSKFVLELEEAKLFPHYSFLFTRYSLLFTR